MQTLCSWGLQAPPALTLPLPQADVDSRGCEAEGALFWHNQVPEGKTEVRDFGEVQGVGLDGPGRPSPGRDRLSGGLGTTHLSFTCQRKMVWGPQPR